jgi:hypothetical protein
MISWAARTRNIGWPHDGDEPEPSFEQLCGQLASLSPTQKYYVETIDMTLFLNRSSWFKEHDHEELQLRGHGQYP